MREFNTRETKGAYSITFETDDKKAFEKVQELCRMLIDGKDGDAIPIEWVDQWIESHTKYWQAVSRSGDPIPMRDTPYQVEEMLEDWEKEIE